MGGSPIHPKAIYMASGREIFSSLTKVVFPLDGTLKSDGCFAAIPGSHKANFERPWSNHPDLNKTLVPIETEPGDAIIFTEALAHGSMVKISEVVRQTIYFCYSVGYMPEWGKLGLKFSDEFKNELNPELRTIIEQK
jgi:ectoine hydroxylase-related dioxygenase (phytanoyl-CoA dioxygenase family)